MAHFTDERRRVLCLHSGGSRGEILRSELRPLFSAIVGRGMLLEFDCVDGHFQCEGDPRTRDAHPGTFYSYLNATKSTRLYEAGDLYPSPPDGARGSYVKLPKAIEAFRDLRLSDDDGGYEGVLGVGEGADLALMLMADAEKRRQKAPFKWAVLAGGGDFGWASALGGRGELFAAPLVDTPTLCTFGRADVEGREAFNAFITLIGSSCLEIASHECGRRPFPEGRAAATALAAKVASFVARVMAPADFLDVARLTTPLCAHPARPPGAESNAAAAAPRTPTRPTTADGGTQT